MMMMMKTMMMLFAEDHPLLNFNYTFRNIFHVLKEQHRQENDTFVIRLYDLWALYSTFAL